MGTGTPGRGGTQWNGWDIYSVATWFEVGPGSKSYEARINLMKNKKLSEILRRQTKQRTKFLKAIPWVYQIKINAYKNKKKLSIVIIILNGS